MRLKNNLKRLGLCWVLAAARMPSPGAARMPSPGVESGADAGSGAWVSHRSGFSCCGAWAAGPRGFCTSVAAPRHVDLPGPGIKPTSLALAIGFLTN